MARLLDLIQKSTGNSCENTTCLRDADERLKCVKCIDNTQLLNQSVCDGFPASCVNLSKKIEYVCSLLRFSLACLRDCVRKRGCLVFQERVCLSARKTTESLYLTEYNESKHNKW